MSNVNIKYSSYKSRAKSKNIQFSLTKEDFKFILKKDCFYCKAPNANGIDRYLNNRGYYHGNIVPCCWTCNRAKSDMDFMEFEQYVQRFTGVDITIERQKDKIKNEPSSIKRADNLFKMFNSLLDAH